MVRHGKAFRKYLGCFSLLFALAACGEVGINYPTLDFTSLISRAKKEGQIVSVGMHDGWPTGQKIWDDLNLYYGLKDEDTDIGDIGLEYAREAKSQGLLAGYQTSYWDEIPTWAKDNSGQYIVSFTGTLAFLYDSAFGNEAPKSFADIAKGDYKVGD